MGQDDEDYYGKEIVFCEKFMAIHNGYSVGPLLIELTELSAIVLVHKMNLCTIDEIGFCVVSSYVSFFGHVLVHKVNRRWFCKWNA